MCEKWFWEFETLSLTEPGSFPFLFRYFTSHNIIPQVQIFFNFFHVSSSCFLFSFLVLILLHHHRVRTQNSDTIFLPLSLPPQNLTISSYTLTHGVTVTDRNSPFLFFASTEIPHSQTHSRFIHCIFTSSSKLHFCFQRSVSTFQLHFSAPQHFFFSLFSALYVIQCCWDRT